MTSLWILLEVTVVLIIALGATRVARHSRAAVRHVLLSATFGVLLILPLASMIAPAIRIQVPVSAGVQAVFAPREVEEQTAVDRSRPSPSPNAADGPTVNADDGRWSWPSLSTLLAGAWVAGAIVFVLPVVVGLWQVRSLRRSGLPWRQGGVTAGVLAKDGGVRRRIDVLLHESVPGPLTFGVVRPAIVLPMDAPGWSQEDLHRAVVHELEHVRRADWVSHCFTRAIVACYWFHPIVWMAWRRLVLEAERACDDAVVRRSDPTAYADQLVILAERLSATASQPQLAMASRRDLVRRVTAVLDARQSRGRAGTAWVGIAVAACALVVMAMAPLRIVATDQTPAAANLPALKFDVVSIKPCPGIAQRPEGTGTRGRRPSNPEVSPGHVYWACVSLTELIDQAWGGNYTNDNPLLNTLPGWGDVAAGRIRGGPSWAADDRYTIEAIISGDTNQPIDGARAVVLRAALPVPIRAMLEDRFQLKLHKATEQRRMYAMTVAPGGFKIKALAPDECWEFVPGRGTSGLDARKRCGNVHGSLPQSVVTALGSGTNDLKTILATSPASKRFEYTGTTMRELALELSGVMDQFVLDKTSLDGRFSFAIEFAADDTTPGVSPKGSGGTTIFKALESVGLKLESTKGPSEYLVIDSAQKPRPNAP